MDSQIGRGTTFRVYLPQVEQKNVPQETVTVCPRARTRKATILVVEDSEDIREIMRQGLEIADYNVLVAADGVAALQVAEGRPEPIHLLITDVMMPGLRGTELAVELHKSRPDMKVIYMSGYSDDILTGVPVPGVFLQKPVEMQVLRYKIADILDLSPQSPNENHSGSLHLARGI